MSTLEDIIDASESLEFKRAVTVKMVVRLLVERVSCNVGFDSLSQLAAK